MAGRYGFPLDRQHILGHSEIPQGIEQGKIDPGPMWSWNRLMAEIANKDPQPPPLPPPSSTDILPIVLGVGLVAAGVYLWRRGDSNAS